MFASSPPAFICLNYHQGTWSGSREAGGQYSLCAPIMRHSSVPIWDEHTSDKGVQVMTVCVTGPLGNTQTMVTLMDRHGPPQSPWDLAPSQLSKKVPLLSTTGGLSPLRAVSATHSIIHSISWSDPLVKSASQILHDSEILAALKEEGCLPLRRCLWAGIHKNYLAAFHQTGRLDEAWAKEEPIAFWGRSI